MSCMEMVGMVRVIVSLRDLSRFSNTVATVNVVSSSGMILECDDELSLSSLSKSDDIFDLSLRDEMKE